MFTWGFWKNVLIRAVKTWAQSGVALIGTSAFGLFSLDVVNFLSVTLGAAFLSVLTSIGSIDVVGDLIPPGES